MSIPVRTNNQSNPFLWKPSIYSRPKDLKKFHKLVTGEGEESSQSGLHSNGLAPLSSGLPRSSLFPLDLRKVSALRERAFEAGLPRPDGISRKRDVGLGSPQTFPILLKSTNSPQSETPPPEANIPRAPRQLPSSEFDLQQCAGLGISPVMDVKLKLPSDAIMFSSSETFPSEANTPREPRQLELSEVSSDSSLKDWHSSIYADPNLKRYHKYFQEKINQSSNAANPIGNFPPPTSPNSGSPRFGCRVAHSVIRS